MSPRYGMLRKLIQDGRVIESKLISTSKNLGGNTPYQAVQIIQF